MSQSIFKTSLPVNTGVLCHATTAARGCIYNIQSSTATIGNYSSTRKASATAASKPPTRKASSAAASSTELAATNIQLEDDEESVEVPGCWSFGGTPCDWEKFSPDVLDHINKLFPVTQDGSSVHSKAHVAVPNKTIQYALY
jgi:hypothetical protein